MKNGGILQTAIITLALIAAFALAGCSGGGGDSGGGQAPSAPGGVSATAGDGQVTVSWNEVSGAESYNLYMAAASGVGKSNYEMKHTGVTSPYLHIGLDNGTAYYFVVTAVNSDGESNESGEVQATPEAGLPGSVNLPETGQAESYASGDDGALLKGVSWPEERFVAGTGDAEDCIIDELTGLMWVMTPPVTGMTWAEALDYANDLDICGYPDWRLPNVNELESLYHAGYPIGEESYATDWLITQGFSGALPEDQYWSSTTYAANTDVAWVVVMWNGDVNRYAKSNLYYAWPVRSRKTGVIQLPKTGQTTSYATGDDGELQKGITWPTTRFTPGTGAATDCVTDNLTHLVWVKAPDTTPRTWEQALAYSNDLSLCGYSDWRLPNRKEIRSVINYGEASPAGWLNTGGFSGVQTASYWSSTTYAYDPGQAWPAIMENGKILEDDKYEYLYTWPVRGGE